MTGLSCALIMISSLAAAAIMATPALADRPEIPPSEAIADCQAVTAHGLSMRFSLWRNLHHRLYAEASASSPSTSGRVPLLADDLTPELLPEERAAWDAALDVYATLAQRDLLSDPELVRIGRILSRSEESLAPTELPLDLRQALTAARPVYERLFWDRHRRINEYWCGALAPRLTRYAEPALGRLREIYEAETPERATIEVTVYANWAGAYTALSPVEIVIASGHPSNAGDAALEIAIHEVSHAMAGPLRRKLDDAARRHSAEPGARTAPRDLWHQVLFYIAGEVIADLIPDYVAYADRNGLWRRVWPDTRDLLEAHLRPVLDGETSLDAALEALVEDLARAEQPRP